MSEEEIIKKANEFISTLNEIIYDESDWYDYEELESAKEQLPVIKGLLKLYGEEKEKNKELERYKKYYRNERNLLDSYISKDEIKQRIKELEEMRDDHADEIKRNVRFYSIYDSYNLQIAELQDLLEEE